MLRVRLLVTLAALAAAASLVAWGVAQGTDAGQARRLLRQSQRLAEQGQAAAARAKLDALLQRFPASAAADDALFALGQLSEQAGEWQRAQQAYARILQDFPMSELAAPAQDALGDVNIRLLLSPTLTGQDTVYVVQSGDRLAGIAKRFHVTVDLLKRINGLSSDLIRPGLRLKIPGGTWSVVVDKSQNILWLKRGEDILKQYRVSTGSHSSTPTGTFRIVNRLANPPWYSDEGVIPFGDPRNILGTRWLGFDKPGYGIHGTTDPSTIGSQVTAGCVRMRNADVEEVFMIMPEGTLVTIIE